MHGLAFLGARTNQEVFLGGYEVYRTKVIPSYLSPVWGESFIVCLSRLRTSPGMQDSSALDGGDIRFEILDHDVRGGGDYLGKQLTIFSRKVVYFTPAERQKKSDRVEHRALKKVE